MNSAATRLSTSGRTPQRVREALAAVLGQRQRVDAGDLGDDRVAELLVADQLADVGAGARRPCRSCRRARWCGRRTGVENSRSTLMTGMPASIALVATSVSAAPSSGSSTIASTLSLMKVSIWLICRLDVVGALGDLELDVASTSRPRPWRTLLIGAEPAVVGGGAGEADDDLLAGGVVVAAGAGGRRSRPRRRRSRRCCSCSPRPAGRGRRRAATSRTGRRRGEWCGTWWSPCEWRCGGGAVRAVVRCCGGAGCCGAGRGLEVSAARGARRRAAGAARRRR